MRFLLRNSANEYDGSWTLAVASWAVVSFCLIFSMLETDIVKIKVPDATLLLGYLAAMTGNYLMRRNTKDKLVSGGDTENQENGER